jgi:hypothetical protein
MIRYTANVSEKTATTAPTPMDPEEPDTPMEASVPSASPTLGTDLLRGADEIAEFVFGDRKHRRKVYYLTGDAKVRLPYFKLGSVICARKSKLLEWIENQERARYR